MARNINIKAVRKIYILLQIIKDNPYMMGKFVKYIRAHSSIGVPDVDLKFSDSSASEDESDGDYIPPKAVNNVPEKKNLPRNLNK